MHFKEYFLLRESPDYILKRFGHDPDLTQIRYANNKESYSVIMYENRGKLWYVYRKDIPRTEPGHLQMRLDLLNSKDEPELIDNVFGEIPKQHLPLLAARQDGVQARIWTENKLMSFWIPWMPQLVPTTLKLMKALNQDPKQYLYEFDGKTYNRNNPKNIGIMDYNAFIEGKVDNSVEAQKAASDAKELRGLQSKVKAGFIKDDPIAKSMALFKQQQGQQI